MHQPCLPHQAPLQGLRAPQALLGQAAKPREGKGKDKEAKKGGTIGKDEDGFTDPEECLMLFGGSDTIHSKHQHKVRYREAYAAESVIPSFLSWSDSPITFDQRDHPF